MTHIAQHESGQQELYRAPLEDGIIRSNGKFFRYGVGTLLASAVGAGAAMVGGAGNAHAEGDPTPVQTDSATQLVVETEVSIYAKLKSFDYNDQEIVADLEEKKEDPSGMHLNRKAGEIWSVSERAQQMRVERLGEGVKITFEEGDNPWDRITSLNPEVNPMDVLRANKPDLKNDDEIAEWALKVQPGDSIFVNNKYLSVPEVASAETVTLPLESGSIYQDLINRGVPEKVVVSTMNEIRKLSGKNEKTERKMHTRDPYVVPANILPVPVAAEIPPAVPEVLPTITLTEPGDSIVSVLARVGSADPVGDGNKVRAMNGGISLEAAANLRIGDSFKVPMDVSVAPQLLAEQTAEVTQDVAPQQAAETQPVSDPPTVQAEVAPETLQLGQKVLFIGDSLTVGMRDLGNLSQSGVENKLTITSDDAETGRSLTEALTRPINFDIVLSQNAIVIELGTNAKEGDETFTNNLRTYIQALKDEAERRGVPMPHIFIVTEFETGDNNVVREETRNPIIMALSEEMGIQVIDWSGFAAGHPELYEGGDGVHPSEHFGDMAAFVSSELARQLGSSVPPSDAAPVTEAVSVPEVITPAPTVESILESIRTQYGNETVDISSLGVFVTETFEQPGETDGISAEAAAQLYKLPPRQAGMDYVTNPYTCVNESFASAPMMAFIVAVQDYARQLTLTDPRFQQYFGFEDDLGDIISGHHNLHDDGRAFDGRSRNNGEGPDRTPNGPLFVANSPSFDKEFNEDVLLFAHGLQYDGIQLLDHIEITSKDVEKDLTGKNEKGDWVAFVNGHGDHIHFMLNKIFAITQVTPNSGALSCEDPSTGGVTDSLNPVSNDVYAPAASEATTVPVVEAAIEVVTPPAEVITEATAPVAAELPPPEATAQPEVKSNIPVDVVAAWQMPAEEYVSEFNNGELYTVELRNGYKGQPNAEVQRAVDLVWRVEGGQTAEDVRNSLTVAFAESAFDNTAVRKNKKGEVRDACAFQINRINAPLVEKYNEKYGTKYTYDDLPKNVELCVRIAFDLYMDAKGTTYDPENIKDWINVNGLELPDDLYERVMNGEVSDGYWPWLMSARNSGKL